MWKLLFVLALALGAHGVPWSAANGYGSPYGRGGYAAHHYNPYNGNLEYRSIQYGYTTSRYQYTTATLSSQAWYYPPTSYTTSTIIDRTSIMASQPWYRNPWEYKTYSTGRMVTQAVDYSILPRSSARVGPGLVRPAPVVTSAGALGSSIRPAPGGGLRIGASYSTDVVALPPVSVKIWPATVIPPPPASNGGACGAIIKLPSKGAKYIQSPKYPKNYPRRSDCVYSLIAPKGKSIKLQFIAMDIEKHARCVWDFIEIFKGGRNGKNITKLCSTKLRTYTIAGGRATVYFHSGGSVQKKGFKIKMTVE
jgi:hypothetical protein